MALRGGPLRSSASAVGVPGWRPEDFLRFETDFLEEGVVKGVGGELAVTRRGAGANLSVDVASGRALIEFTTTLLSPNETVHSWLYSDATINIPLTTADPTNPRKDRIVAKFIVSVDPNTVASDIVSITVVTGTPAGSPAAPAEPSNAITLAIVTVPAGDTTITNDQITDSRTFVTMDTAVLADIVRVLNLASNSNGKGASLVGVEDAAANFSGTTVEAVLAEIFNSIPSVDDLTYGDGSDGVLNVTSGTTTIDASAAVNGFLIKQYTSFNVSVGATLAFSNIPAGGLIFVPLVQGAFTCAGTIDLSSCGSDGGAAITLNRTSNGSSTQAGNPGTIPNNAVGQERRGLGGSFYNATQNIQLASGGGGSANAFTDGGNAADVTGSSQTATGGLKGTGITAQLVAMATQLGITICPGSGGASGGVVNRVDSYGSGTYSATAAAGTKGGGSLLAKVGGNFSFTGTLKMGSANCSNASTSLGTATGSNYSNTVCAGGPSAGAAGNAVIFVKKTATITNSGTVQASAGTVGTGSVSSQTNGSGSGGSKLAGDGGVSASGTLQTFRIL